MHKAKWICFWAKNTFQQTNSKKELKEGIELILFLLGGLRNRGN